MTGQLPLTHGGPPEPFNCPECKTIAWASGWQTEKTCRWCGHTWQVRRSVAVAFLGERADGETQPSSTPTTEGETRHQ